MKTKTLAANRRDFLTFGGGAGCGSVSWRTGTGNGENWAVSVLRGRLFLSRASSILICHFLMKPFEQPGWKPLPYRRTSMRTNSSMTLITSWHRALMRSPLSQ